MVEPVEGCGGSSPSLITGGMMFRTYREICKGVTDRGRVLPTGYDFRNYAGCTDCFYSLYGWDHPVSDIGNDKNRIIDHLVIDLDTEDLDVVRTIINRCNAHSIEHILYFSGTGFHVVIPNIWQFHSQDIYNKTIQNTMMHYFPEGDPMVYDARRIIRMPYTINSKSGLPKVELSSSEITINKEHDIDSVTMHATEYLMQDKLPYARYTKLPTQCGDAYDSWPKIHSVGKPVINPILRDDHFLPSPKCIHKLLRAGSVEGQRHITAMRLASHLLHYCGLPVNAVVAIIDDWWKGGEKDDLERMVTKVKEKYKYGCKDAVLAACCHSNCAYFRGKDYMAFGVNLTDTHVSYLDKVKNDEYWDLSKFYREIENPFTIMNNDLVSIIGTQGAGKSTMYIDLVLKLGLNVVISNIDMAHDMLVRKLVQHELKITKSDIFAGKRLEEQLAITRQLERRITVTPTANLDEVDAILRNPQHYGLTTKPDAWVFDHVGNISMPNVSGYERMRELGKTLKDLAVRHDILIIALGHVTRENSRNNILDINSARDANLGESSDVMIGIVRHGLKWIKGAAIYTSKQVTIFSVKYRDNDPFNFDRMLNTDYGTFENLNNDQTELELT